VQGTIVLSRMRFASSDAGRKISLMVTMALARELICDHHPQARSGAPPECTILSYASMVEPMKFLVRNTAVESLLDCDRDS